MYCKSKGDRRWYYDVFQHTVWRPILSHAACDTTKALGSVSRKILLKRYLYIYNLTQSNGFIILDNPIIWFGDPMLLVFGQQFLILGREEGRIKKKSIASHSSNTLIKIKHWERDNRLWHLGNEELGEEWNSVWFTGWELSLDVSSYVLDYNLGDRGFSLQHESIQLILTNHVHRRCVTHG